MIDILSEVTLRDSFNARRHEDFLFTRVRLYKKFVHGMYLKSFKIRTKLSELLGRVVRSYQLLTQSSFFAFFVSLALATKANIIADDSSDKICSKIGQLRYIPCII